MLRIEKGPQIKHGQMSLLSDFLYNDFNLLRGS